MKPKSVILQTRIDPDTFSKLQDYAKQHDLSASEVVRQALVSYVCSTNVVQTQPAKQQEPTKNAKLEFARSLLTSLKTKPKPEPEESLVKPILIEPRPREDDWNAIDSA